MFSFTHPQYIYCARYIVLFEISTISFSTISFIRINLFLSFDFFHISLFFYFENQKLLTNRRRNRFNRDRLLSSFHLDHVFQFFNFFSTPFNFFRWYSADCKRLGTPGLPSCSCGLRPQGLGLCSARRAGQQCASARSRYPKVVGTCLNDVYSSSVQYPQSLSLR